MDFDTTTLCRLQFGLTASYHVIFPSLIIGLTAYLLSSAIAWQVWRNPAHQEQYRFWAWMLVPVFVLAVITGTVLAHQLDHVFTGFYGLTTAVLVPIRETEVMATVLLEAGCFAIMVWGWRKVGDRLHLLATCLFALGVLTAAVCILGRNSWMHTPAGYAIVDGEIQVVDWLSAVFNPSFPYRFAHMVGAACVSTALLVLAVCSWYLLSDRHREFAGFGLRHAVLVVGVLAPLQLLSGDLHGLKTRDYQPVKLAAMEALWETKRGAPLVLFALPDREGERNRWEIAIPRLASIIVTHDLDGEIRGLREVPAEDRPNVPLVFAAFRVMVVSGLAIVAIGATGLFPALARAALRCPLVLARRVLCLSARIRGHHRRVVCHRSRTTAVGGAGAGPNGIYRRSGRGRRLLGLAASDQRRVCRSIGRVRDGAGVDRPPWPRRATSGYPPHPRTSRSGSVISVNPIRQAR